MQDPKTPNVPMDKWGKDHWTLLAYIETCCVDNPTSEPFSGKIDYTRIRINPKRHQGQAWRADKYSSDRAWQPSYGTRLRGFFEDQKNPALLLGNHDDIDCLEDMEAAGLIEIISLVNGFVRLTPDGAKLTVLLRAHKMNGGQFANFTPPAQQEVKS